MNLSDVYNRVKEGTYTNEDLKFLLDEEKNIFSKINFVIYYDIVKELKNNDEKEFVNKFIECCEKKDNFLARIYRLAFDEKFITNDNIESMLSRVNFPYVFPFSISNIYFAELEKYIDKERLKPQYFQYFNKIIDEYELGEISYNKIISDVNFEYIPLNSFSTLIDMFYNDVLFRNKISKYFSNHPDEKIKISYKPGCYDKYSFISKNVLCSGILLNDMLKFDSILKNECAYTNGYDFSQEALIKLYDYYHDVMHIQSAEDVCNCYKALLDEEYLNNLANNNLNDSNNLKLTLHILGQNKQKKLYIKYAVVEECYDELCKLDPSNIFIDFGGIEGEGIMTFGQYKKSKSFYDNIANEIKQYNFTPLEAYLYTCNITMNFKRYKFYRNDKLLDQKYQEMSRNPFYIVDHEYIVCAGYANFAIEIFKRLNIPTSYLVLGPKECGEWHAEILTYLVDPKYNVNGIYMGEVTGSKKEGNISCYKSLHTKSKESYYKHQVRGGTEKYFLDAIESLPVSDVYKDSSNPEFFDIINREISSMTMATALKNMFLKVNSEISEVEVLDKIYDAGYEGYLLTTMLNKKLKDVMYRGQNISNLFDINYFLENNVYENVCLKRQSFYGRSKNLCAYGLKVYYKNKDDVEVAQILSLYSAVFEDEITRFDNSNPNYPELLITVPTDITVNDLKNIIMKKYYLINKILEYTINKNTILDSENEIISRKL